jgi:DNA-binding MarR family transcriptional regulator
VTDKPGAPSLFDYAKTRRSDPSTSHAAAATVDVTVLEKRVLDALKAKGRMTTTELADHLDMSLVTVSPRMRPLADKALVRDSGERRKNPSGRNAIVWEAT